MDYQGEITQDKDGKRLDAMIAELLQVTRARARQLIETGCVQLDDVIAQKASASIHVGQKLVITEVTHQQPSLDLEVVYEDDDLVVVNKPAGLLVHPTASHKHEPTVVDFIKPKTTDDDPIRPGIVHRLDRNTSGLLVLAKTKAAKEHLQEQFRDHTIQKTYLALVIGHLEPAEAMIKVPLSRSRTHALKRVADPHGRVAETAYKVQESIGDFDLVEAQPRTGRTHQLRAHFAHIGHPIVGDKLYNAGEMLGLTRYFLHAGRLQFTAPSGKAVDVSAPLPKELEAVLTKLRLRV